MSRRMAQRVITLDATCSESLLLELDFREPAAKRPRVDVRVVPS